MLRLLIKSQLISCITSFLCNVLDVLYMKFISQLVIVNLWKWSWTHFGRWCKCAWLGYQDNSCIMYHVFAKATNGCVHIISYINDEESNIHVSFSWAIFTFLLLHLQGALPTFSDILMYCDIFPHIEIVMLTHMWCWYGNF